MARPGFVALTSSIQGLLSGPESQIGRSGLSQVLAFSHNVEMPLSTDTGVFGGQPMHRPVVFVKPIDAVSPQLYQALCERERLSSVLFFWTQFSTQGQVELLYEIELRQARVISLSPEMPDLRFGEHDALPYLEKVGLIYETINWRYGPSAESEYQTKAEVGKL